MHETELVPYKVSPREDTGLYNAKFGIWLFLASEIMLFGSLFSAYILLRVGSFSWPVLGYCYPAVRGDDDFEPTLAGLVLSSPPYGAARFGSLPGAECDEGVYAGDGRSDVLHHLGEDFRGRLRQVLKGPALAADGDGELAGCATAVHRREAPGEEGAHQPTLRPLVLVDPSVAGSDLLRVEEEGHRAFNGAWEVGTGDHGDLGR